MQSQEPENPRVPEDAAVPVAGEGDPSADAAAREALGAVRDMTAGSPENWEIQPAPAAASAPGEAAAPPPAAGAVAVEGDESFRVKLEMFEGPLELLLHLVREHKLDIHDIPIAFITVQYLKYIELMRQLNINVASEYLVMASYLVYIKSRTLLPQPEGDEEAEEDPEVLRQELQRQLIEYQKFKQLSEVFRRAEEEQSFLYTRGGNGDGIVLTPEDDEPPRLEVTVFDLISAIQHLIDSIGEEGVHLVEIDELEIADRQTFLLERLEEAGAEGVVFQELIRASRMLEVIVTFLALLELIRGNLIVAYQPANFAEIRIVKAVTDD